MIKMRVSMIPSANNLEFRIQNPESTPEVFMKDPGNGQQEQRGIGEKFQQETKYFPDRMSGHSLDWEHRPERYKSYPESVPKIKLPEPKFGKDANFWEAVLKRRSVRKFSRDLPLPLETLSALLWAAQGITAEAGDFHFRTVPSAGGLFPIETYVMAEAIEGLGQGIYHFRPYAFDLEFIKPGDFSRDLAQAALGQDMVAHAQATFVWTAVVERSKWKYHERAYRYIYLDAGHIGQNLYLAGTASGLGVCAIGALYDDAVNALIGVDGVEETVVYMASAGWPAKIG
ncbi:MAG: SagB-type dehydrogenase domain protein [Acidobacteria bacterium]|jgi:SagB-type dehydrogenase family enzyme|nr:SagB-type dehydrogenase domain protein [Acidobacteriota bacterium]